MKKILFVIFIPLILVSCRKIYDFSQLQEAQSSIVLDLESKKIVFVGENHSNIYPILYFTKYLYDFYDAGLRYIFLEGNYPMLQFDSNVYKIIPPWINSGWRYEEHILEERILNINNMNKNDPIHIIFPEEGFIEDANYTLKGQCELLNKRDYYAQSNIIKSLEGSKKSEKAIVFYGSDHGNRNVQKFYDFDWKSIGVYLNEYYGKNFVNYKIDTFYDSSQIYGKFGEKESVVVSDSIKLNLYREDFISSYERLCITKTELYGVPYCYIPTKKNIDVLIQNVQLQINSSGRNKTQPTVVGNNYMQFLLATYYLKYYFGNDFPYTFENDFNQLQPALEKISPLINKNQLYGDSKIEELEEYAKYLYAYGMLTEYLNNPKPEYIEGILYNMKEANKINSHDIWPQYWISYFRTEQAGYSEKKSDYRKALREWEKLLRNQLIYASPVLKLTYRKMALCEEKTGDFEKQQFYLEKARQVSSLLDFDYKQYVYFGY